MEVLDKLLIWSHILAGALVLLSGLAAMVIRPKGGRWHRIIGKVYFYGMLCIVASAVGIMVLFRFNLFLLVIAVFSFYMSFTGYRVLKRKKPGQQTWVDWMAAIVALLSGAGLLLIGIKSLVFKGPHPMFILCIIFGLMTAVSGWGDIRVFRRKEVSERMWWWYHHMQAMIGSYIAAFSAFVVQNGDRFLPDFQYGWLFWLAPTIVGTPAIMLWLRHYRQKFDTQKG